MPPSRDPELSRRIFLGGLAAAPLAARLGRGEERAGVRVAVVGAGAFGGWTALWLRRLGAEVTLVDTWGPGNPRASSGGETRVIRAVYGADRIYVEMVRRAFELWRELESATGASVYRETGSLWMFRVDDGYVRAAKPIMEEVGFALEHPAVEDAARRFPQIDFGDVEGVWFEPRSGALAAREACAVVRDLLVREGGVYRTVRAEPGPLAGGRMSELHLADGSRLAADHYVFACGPWLGQLFPGAPITTSRQEVYYFGTPPGSDLWAPPRLPVWIDFGERIVYGVPDVGGRGFKIADDTRGEPFDPTTGDRTPTAAGIAAARELLARRFPVLRDAPLLEARVCQYENSPDGHLIVDRHPEAANVTLAGGGSGHGYKLGPAVGELVARSIVEGAALEERFALARLEGLEGTRTQFESRADRG